METPNLSHISSSDYDHVYEPAEDSFLMIDALEKDKQLLTQLNPTFCLEIGSGSGVIITAFAMAFPSCVCTATDINQKACEVTLKTSKANGTKVDSINADLAITLQPNLFDVIIFNPPYVVTESSEILSSDIAKSWAGGIKGREVIDRFLSAMPNLLSKTGILYLLLIKENVPDEVVNVMNGLGFAAICVLQRKVRNEHQFIFKFIKR